MQIEKGAKWVKFDLMERFMRDVFKGLGNRLRPADVQRYCRHMGNGLSAGLAQAQRCGFSGRDVEVGHQHLVSGRGQALADLGANAHGAAGDHGDAAF